MTSARATGPPRPNDRARRVANTLQIAALGRVERRVPFLPTPIVERLQRRRVEATVKHAYETVPFYRRAMTERGLRPEDFRRASDLSELPLIDGALVQSDPRQFVSWRYARSSRQDFHTSGSEAGLRRLVYWDDRALLLWPARAERSRVVLNRLAGEAPARTMLRELAGERAPGRLAVVARVAGDPDGHRRLSIFPVDLNSRTQRAILSQRTLIPRRAAHYDLLSPQDPYEIAADRMDSIRPRIVFSYGSYADEFFRYLADCGRSVALPRLWVFAGDMISQRGRELAEQLGCRLYSSYSSAEAGKIGFQCERTGGFHLNVDLCATCIVGADGRTAPPGEIGEVVISNLHNRAMPLLNYRQGDRAALGVEACGCGRSLPILDRLEGRRSDVVTLADGRRISSLSLEGLFRVELRRTRQVQIAHPERGALRWRIVPFADVVEEDLRASLVQRGRDVLGPDTKVTVELCERIAKTGQGKLLPVVSG